MCSCVSHNSPRSHKPNKVKCKLSEHPHLFCLDPPWSLCFPAGRFPRTIPIIQTHHKVILRLIVITSDIINYDANSDQWCSGGFSLTLGPGNPTIPFSPLIPGRAPNPWNHQHSCSSVVNTWSFVITFQNLSGFMSKNPTLSDWIGTMKNPEDRVPLAICSSGFTWHLNLPADLEFHRRL